MAARGTAAKSPAGNSMSKYDVEVEKRLQIIDARLAEIEVKLHELKTASTPTDTPTPTGEVCVEALYKTLQKMEPNFDQLYIKFSS